MLCPSDHQHSQHNAIWWWCSVLQWCKPFIPSRHIHSIIKHLVYYTTLGIVKINIFEHCVILCQDCVNSVPCVGRVWYVWAVGRKCEKNMTDSSQSRKWQTIVWSHYGAILDLLDNENNGSQAEVVLPLHTTPACGDRNKIQARGTTNNPNVIQCLVFDWNIYKQCLRLKWVFRWLCHLAW